MGSKNVIDEVEAEAVARIAREIAQRGLSVRSVGQSIGVGKSRVSDLLNGLTSCTVTDFVNLCTLLNLSPGEVMNEAEAVVAARREVDEGAADGHVDLGGWAVAAHDPGTDPEAEAEAFGAL